MRILKLLSEELFSPCTGRFPHLLVLFSIFQHPLLRCLAAFVWCCLRRASKSCSEALSLGVGFTVASREGGLAGPFHLKISDVSVFRAFLLGD